VCGRKMLLQIRQKCAYSILRSSVWQSCSTNCSGGTCPHSKRATKSVDPIRLGDLLRRVGAKLGHGPVAARKIEGDDHFPEVEDHSFDHLQRVYQAQGLQLVVAEQTRHMVARAARRVGLAYAGYSAFAPGRTPRGQLSLINIDRASFSSFEQIFDDAADRVRIVGLFSPT